MKQILIAILIGIGICTLSYFDHNYTRENCVVVEASPIGAIFEDDCGFTWFEEGKGYEVGQIADLKMQDNFSSGYIDDDVIKKVEKK
jgi:hypothetical protein